MITWSQISFQDACSPVIEELLFFHDFVIVILSLVVTLVGYWVVTFLSQNKSFFNFRQVIHRSWLEFMWTLIPLFLLIEVSIPSLFCLYAREDTRPSTLTVKVTGHQWYWTYELRDFWNFSDKEEVFDSYIVSSPSASFPLRLLDTDSTLTLPVDTQIRILVTSSDVLHSWALPAAGLKADACPGRLNQLIFVSNRLGEFYGQCSEICGANHRFIPIKLLVVKCSEFVNILINSHE